MLKSEQCKQDLLTFKKYADECNVIFFLILGTCLGAIRENSFIENDDDLDVGVYAEDKNLPLLIDKLKKDFQYKCQEKKNKILYLRVMMKNKVDINPLYLVDGKRCFLKNCDFYGKEYPEKFFETLKVIDFVGTKLYVPSPPEEYLEFLYGDWKTPNRNKSQRPLVKINLK